MTRRPSSDRTQMCVTTSLTSVLRATMEARKRAGEDPRDTLAGVATALIEAACDALIVLDGERGAAMRLYQEADRMASFVTD